MLKPKLLLQVVMLAFGAGLISASAEESVDYLGALWHPSHFQPQIQHTTNEQCLACHKEVLEDRPLAQSPAGVQAWVAAAVGTCADHRALIISCDRC